MDVWVQSICAGIGALIAVNSAVPLFSIITSRCLRSQMMYQTLANLAAVEFGQGLLLMAACLQWIVNSPPRICLLLKDSARAAWAGCLVALVMLCLERHLAVGYSLRYRAFMTRYMRLFFILVPWVFSAAFFVLVSGLREVVGGFCHVRLPPWQLRTASTIVELAACVIIVLLNLAVARESQRHCNSIRRQLNGVPAQRELNEFRSFRVVFKVVAVYLLFSMPLTLFETLDLAGMIESKNDLRTFLLVIRMILPLLDGWLFGFWYVDMKVRYLEVLCCSRRVQEDSVVFVSDHVPRRLQQSDLSVGPHINLLNNDGSVLEAAFQQTTH